MTIEGKAHRYGRDIDTDVIIPARYLTTTDQAELGKHCLEDLDIHFIEKVRPGDIIVADENFGCGSSREHAPIAIKGAGVSLVLASSFARIFYRNSINVGLPIVECPEAVANIGDGDIVKVDLSEGLVEVVGKGSFRAQPYPSFLQTIIDKGGLVEWAKQQIVRKS